MRGKQNTLLPAKSGKQSHMEISFMNNQEVQQIAKGKKQETHKHLKVLIGVQKPTS